MLFLYAVRRITSMKFVGHKEPGAGTHVETIDSAAQRYESTEAVAPVNNHHGAVSWSRMELQLGEQWAALDNCQHAARKSYYGVPGSPAVSFRWLGLVFYFCSGLQAGIKNAPPMRRALCQSARILRILERTSASHSRNRFRSLWWPCSPAPVATPYRVSAGCSYFSSFGVNFPPFNRISSSSFERASQFCSFCGVRLLCSDSIIGKASFAPEI